tara:strand:+ start:233 stop:1015 length:783 start_codon:yes stop_codon:yes gene_type:complete
MSKYLVYMVAVNHNSSKFKNSDYSQYSIKSWEAWCKRRNIDFVVVDKHNDKYSFPIWNKLDVCDVGKDYDKIAIVDSDTMIHWSAPNILEHIESGVYGVQDNANLRWLNESVGNYGGEFFSDFKINLDKYINAGVIYLDKESLSIYEKLRDFYFENREKLDSWNKGGGREQTLFNFLLQKNNYDINLLSPEWNMFSMHKKEMFSYNWQDTDGGIAGKDTTPHFIKYSWVWHFTGFPIEQRTSIMKQTWDLVGYLYEGYEE